MFVLVVTALKVDVEDLIGFFVNTLVLRCDLAYVVLDPDRPAPATAELADLLRQRLPGFLVLTRWSVLEKLPVNANGKLDRSAPTGAGTAPGTGRHQRHPGL